MDMGQDAFPFEVAEFVNREFLAGAEHGGRQISGGGPVL
jgi:hypothetical protein